MNSRKSDKKTETWIAYVATFPPRECGIATFTQDLTNAMDDLLYPAVKHKIIAMNTKEVERYRYPKKVLLQVDQDRPDEYLKAADKVNETAEIKLVNIQHEFGIFGGEYGEKLLLFLGRLKKPAVITFHTVLPGPDEKLRETVRRLAEKAGGIIVMTGYSKKILIDDYALPAEKVTVIPHGIHPVEYTPSRHAKTVLGFGDNVVLSTFGLLGRGKGLEYVIESLPEVAKVHKKFVYVIFGMTHPAILKQEGESYRNTLINRIYELGLSEHVKFYNRYFSLDELLQFLKATDIYVSPSLNPHQAVSGTLSYALGTGRAVVSTAFAQAKEDVTEDVGTLVDFRNSKAYTDAFISLIGDEKLRKQKGMNAYFKTRKWIWPNVATGYFKLFSSRAPELAAAAEYKRLPRVNLDHLARLTDDFGIIQFARLASPDPASGYTLDDNARALLVVSKCYLRKEASKSQAALAKLVATYFNFITHVFREDGTFANYVRHDRSLNEELNRNENLEDANSRALYALAFAASNEGMPREISAKALSMLKTWFVKGAPYASPRAGAYAIKALSALIEKGVTVEGSDLPQKVREYCGRFTEMYEKTSSESWQWFENYLTYSNAVLPEALFLGYNVLKDSKLLAVANKTLDFLISKSFMNGIYVPIGQDGWCHKDGERKLYDQQPEDVLAMITALKAAFDATGNAMYDRLRYKAFSWFLGDNSINQMVYDTVTGGCYDGLSEKSINLNQGAESTISYLLSRLSFAEDPVIP